MIFEILLLTAIIVSIVLLVMNGIEAVMLRSTETINMKDMLLSSDELSKHARDIAESHHISKKIKDAPHLLSRLRDNYKVITRTKALFQNDTDRDDDTLPAAEWLLDNYYILHEAFLKLENNLLNEFSDKLPVISAGIYKNYPRSYAISSEILSHTDGEINENIIKTFILGYQSSSILDMGELWSLQLMLKVASLEYIRQLCDKMQYSREQWQRAEEAADFIKNNISLPQNILMKTFEEKYGAFLEHSFVERLMFSLRSQNIKSHQILPIIKELLDKKGLSTEGLVEAEHEFQSLLQLTMGNLITTVRNLETLDFNSLYEDLSIVEQLLKQDTGSVYNKMDNNTKLMYRDRIKHLAKKYGTTEIHIARTALHCTVGKDISPQNHIGYYLMDRGIQELVLKAAVRKKYSPVNSFYSKGHKGGYITAIIFLSLLISSSVVWAGFNHDISGHRALAVLSFVICFIPAMELVTLFVNLFLSLLVKPNLLPKLQLKEGIPDDSPVMLIIPTLLSSKGRVRDMAQQLRSAYLSNKSDNLYFTLVADLKDSATDTLESDAEIINEGKKLIEGLNNEYPGCGKRFFFVYRDRKYVADEHKWMVWERKRGAVLEFVRLLKGERGTGFENSAAELKNLPNIKYIVTLDADTMLPLGGVKKLVGIMLHPLNKPVVDKSRGIVISGYGLVQPRIGINIKSSMASTYSMVYASNGGIDTYSGAVSDIYQDLFGEGIFTGKGIFDVDAYYEVLNHAIPENKILSHDLLEGSFLRTGLATDVMLLDSFPSKYNSAAMRLHRWVRGDWQLIGYLGSNILNDRDEKVRNPLNVVSKWKIFDNLRRSLLMPALMLLLLLAFTIFPFSDGIWASFFLLVTFSPFISYVLSKVLSGRITLYRDKNFAKTMSGLSVSLIMSFLNIAFLAHQGYLMLSAVFTTLWRVLVSKKNLLQWVTAADMEVLLKNRLITYLRFMWFSPLLGVVLLGSSLILSKEYLFFGIVLFITFIMAPMFAYYISQPLDEEEDEEPLKTEDILLIRKIARKCWAFYEDFSLREDNYLPPDNYQEEPTTVVAHRTSPTNIGFLLLSYLAAKDLGFITARELLELLDRTLTTIERMDKWKGHLYNWYDTKTLNVLRPRYISTVDSGNLAGYLIVIISALEDKAIMEDDLKDLIKGLRDIAIISGETEENGDSDLKGLIQDDIVDIAKIQELLSLLNTELSKVSDLSGPAMEAKITERYYWLNKLKLQLNRTEEVLENKENRQELEERAAELKNRFKKLLDDMNFKVLYEPKRELFSIGYNVDEGRLTKSYYDLLASEARLSSFIAIARGEVPHEHWFSLGRKLAKIDGYRGLVSWTGTMFEYLMPLLVMESYKGTLLSETYRFVLQNQIKHGVLRGIPWGVSESGFNEFDVSLNYQYKAFGIAELALKRGQENDVVIAPYATLMALMVEPNKSVENIRKLMGIHACGFYGLYEAIDFTPKRVMDDTGYSIVRSYMAHHQGMGLIAVVNLLKDNVMQKRFEENPMIKATNILLQERLPDKTIFNRSHYVPNLEKKPHHWEYKESIRKLSLENKAIPSVQLLSNGAYSVMLTDTGLGYGKLNEIALYRWSSDIVSRKTGFFIFVQNMNSNEVWSAAFEPLRTRPDSYNVVFAPDKATFTRKDGSLETRTEITISPEDNVEIRKVSIINHGEKVREVEVTSYLEVLLTTVESDLAHPAFSNLFIRTEYCIEEDTLVASRRPRSEDQPTMWGFMHALVEGDEVGSTTFETDRLKFIGRNRDISNPAALDVSQPLTNSQGAVIDPVFSIRKRVIIPPNTTAVVAYVTGFGESREKVLKLSRKYGEAKNVIRAFELSYTRSHIEARFLGLKPSENLKYMEFAPLLMGFPYNKKMHAEFIGKNKKGQPGLWTYGISGDVPIMAVKVSNLDEIGEIAFYIKAHEFYRHRGVYVDMVIILEDEDSGYIQPLYLGLKALLNTTHLRDMAGKRGGVFILDKKPMPEEDLNLILSYSAFYIDDLKLSPDIYLPQYIEKAKNEIIYKSVQSGRELKEGRIINTQDNLLYNNSFGGFTGDDREYVIQLQKGKNTPLPWVNVISGRSFGFQISESGGGCTWAENGRENKLTPWSNDPVTDPAGEVIYIKDIEENLVYTATPKPMGEAELFTVRHGIGYSIFEQSINDISISMTVFAASEEKVKLSLLNFVNKSEKERKLALTYYLRPVLGVNDIQTRGKIVTSVNKGKGYITAVNSYNTDFPGRMLFVGCSEKLSTFTCDRQEFLGAGGDTGKPRALFDGRMTEQQGVGLDQCIAYSVEITLEAGEEKQLVFLLGQGYSEEDVERILQKLTDPVSASHELNIVKNNWSEIIETVNVSTPDKSMDILLNSWLLYQVVSCRLWARAAFYQSGGAFGFRDQLQDVMAVIHARPDYVRKQILLHASRQFVEGDVQHWWHEQAGKGIRTRYSDDLLWLPYVTCDYINNTGDFDILKEMAGFLESPVLSQGEDERYEVPAVSSQKGTLYEHCIRAIEIGIRRGPHGIPLMGSGDWNDGMNTVGNKGTGESVWLGWFLYEVLMRFIPVCERLGDMERAEKYKNTAAEIVDSIEENAWDGNWYRRAFFDDGTPLGSSKNSECTIDSIAQSWAAITGAGRKERVEEALNSVEKYLIDNEAGIIKLLTPPFDKSDLHPGYIKSYLPGVRENGGQYTHASTWVVMAFAKMGMGDRAVELFNMINPINHTRTKTECQRYKTEPYVMSADVYAVDPNAGRGGWSWYTGTAGWMYRVGIEHILGIKKQNGLLIIDPCIPSTWDGYKVRIREGQSLYTINISNPQKVCRGVAKISVDGANHGVGPIQLIDDGKNHAIEVLLGRAENEA